MIRFITAMVLTASALLVVALAADANPGMSGPSSKPAPQTLRPSPRPPIRALPPVVVRRPPPVVAVMPAVPVAPSGGGVITNGAWVAMDPLTGRYSVAFDSPGVGGMGILMNAGYTVVVRGPTTWTDATEYLKGIGAPGW